MVGLLIVVYASVTLKNEAELSIVPLLVLRLGPVPDRREML